MTGILFLAVAWALGLQLTRLVFGPTIDRVLATDFFGRKGCVPPWAVELPVGFTLGTMLCTWAVYMVAYLLQRDTQPLAPANLIVLPVIFLLWMGLKFRAGPRAATNHTAPCSGHWPPVVLAVGLCVAGTGLLWQSMRYAAPNELALGLSVWSDFAAHLAVIRSFSHGHNFPTEYPFFTDGSARYHFMFQFLAGNLEFLGLPLDLASNLPSLGAWIACGIMLYSLGAYFTGRRSAGIIVVVLFFFRSSFAWYDLLRSTQWRSWWSRVITNSEYIGRTQHEDWGLWNQNIYLNQRHLVFAMTLLWFALLLCAPLVRQMHERLAAQPRAAGVRFWLFSPEAWLPRGGWVGLCVPVALGCTLGIMAFWNGAVVICSLVILFGMAVFSTHRLELLALAVGVLVPAFLQNRLFLGPGALAVKPEFYFGFLAASPSSFLSVLQYYWDLLGPMPIVVAVVLLAGRTAGRGGVWALALAFVLPVVLATTVRLTPDVAINHKYVMISVILLNIAAAALIAELWRRAAGMKILAAGLLWVLTATGAVDLITTINRNRLENAVQADLNHPLVSWAQANTSSKEVILSPPWALHPWLLSGRRIYLGWSYYPWGAGYDVAGRTEFVRSVYSATDPDTVRTLLSGVGIRYLAIDNMNREQTDYPLQEEMLLANFPTVFSHDDLLILQVD